MVLLTVGVKHLLQAMVLLIMEVKHLLWAMVLLIMEVEHLLHSDRPHSQLTRHHHQHYQVVES